MSSPRLNVPIPKQLDEFVGELIESGLYSNKSEYVRYLIREDYKKNRDMYPEMPKKKNNPAKRLLNQMICSLTTGDRERR